MKQLCGYKSEYDTFESGYHTLSCHWRRSSPFITRFYDMILHIFMKYESNMIATIEPTRGP